VSAGGRWRGVGGREAIISLGWPPYAVYFPCGLKTESAEPPTQLSLWQSRASGTRERASMRWARCRVYTELDSRHGGSSSLCGFTRAPTSKLARHTILRLSAPPMALAVAHAASNGKLTRGSIAARDGVPYLSSTVEVDRASSRRAQGSGGPGIAIGTGCCPSVPGRGCVTQKQAALGTTHCPARCGRAVPH
jgi:hypothetical protein